MSYLWLKAFHLIGVVTWFAGLFYIFRLYVYHVENKHKPEVTALLEVMERRLYRGICWPAMVFTAIFGTALFLQTPDFYLAQGWFHAKLLGLAILLGYHFYSGKVRRDLAAGRCTLTFAPVPADQRGPDRPARPDGHHGRREARPRRLRPVTTRLCTILSPAADFC